ncbi:hypothetical protein [Halobacillus sp. BBL2006]|uniref:hypothetical protein n=1 Tax=Halobacillus sp. BBL2006 TaxID=1543706 RepID=UPI000543C1A5|nr:hypothetical protein [Halobacillus sp. BBL2006]KHE73202.1 hypothetical protein LD39_00575 [Halobacillus sp. BBL2006]
MISGGWILAGLFTLLGLPLFIGWLRDVLGWNTNRFYGDEMNKKKRSKKEEAFDKASRYYGQHNHWGGGSED